MVSLPLLTTNCDDPKLNPVIAIGSIREDPKPILLKLFAKLMETGSR